MYKTQTFHLSKKKNALRTTVTQALNDATAAQAKYKATQKYWKRKHDCWKMSRKIPSRIKQLI